MYLMDGNIFIYSHREELEKHNQASVVLNKIISSNSKFAVSENALISFMRIVTNPKIFSNATPSNLAINFCKNIIDCDNCIIVRPEENHFLILCELILKYHLKSKLISDAYLAALAIEHSCTLITYDSDFIKFKELKSEIL